VEEAIAMLKEKELGVHERLGRIFMMGLRMLLEGNREESLKVCEERLNEGFQDPEGRFYMARELSYLGETASAITQLKTVIDNGYRCYPQLASDPWFDPIRGDAEFKQILHRAEVLHQEAIGVFKAEGGPALLGQA